MRHIICGLILVIYSSAGAMTPLVGDQLQEQLSPYQDIKSLLASFKQIRTIKRWQTSISTKGTLQFEKGTHSQIIWEITHPEYSALKFSPQGFSVKANKNDPSWKSIKSPSLKKQIEPIFSWLSFDAQKISQNYSVFSEQKDVFKLVPKDKASPLKSILIQGHKGRVQQVTLTEKTDDTINIKFKTVKIKK